MTNTELFQCAPLPSGRLWHDVIGFDPIEHFSDTNMEDAYKTRIWARSGLELPAIPPYQLDPTNQEQILPHMVPWLISQNYQHVLL